MDKEECKDPNRPPFRVGEKVVPDTNPALGNPHFDHACYTVREVDFRYGAEMWFIKVTADGGDGEVLEYYAWRFCPYVPPFDPDLDAAVMLLTRYREFIRSASEDALCLQTIGRLAARQSASQSQSAK